MGDRGLKHHRRGAAVGMLAGGAVALGSACGDSEPEPPPSAPLVERLSVGEADRIDILLAIDNSRSMADKQEILAYTIPHLVAGFLNPPCVDPADPSIEVPVASPTYMCPTGLRRAHEPVIDAHIGVVTSSLGGHGSDACPATAAQTQSNDDRGHLIARTSPDQYSDLAGSTYRSKLFLAWDPAQKKDGTAGLPGSQVDGEADLDVDSTDDVNSTAFVPVLEQMVRGAGEVGCGYEAQLESWYRFLVDPEPHQTITVVDGQATPQGMDAELLAQRADFLRPNSLLAILMLTDENDCSIRESGQYYLGVALLRPRLSL